MMQRAGMQAVSGESLTFGVCHLYVGRVAKTPGTIEELS
jgi:hypothetical protein